MDRILAYLEHSKQMIVQTPDEFLKSFSINQFNDQNIINEFKNIIKQNKRIAGGGVGAIYNISNKDLVLKVSNICPGGKMPIGLLGKLCKMAQNGDLIFRIPNTETGKAVIYAPNYILEAIIGIILERLKWNTPSFTRIYGFQYDINDTKKPVYMLQEKLQPLVDYISFDDQSPIRFLHCVVQIIQALYVAQEKSRYVHYDLHIGNIMARPWDNKKTVRIYELGNGNYFYTFINFDTVIIDYGHNRMETNNSVMSPQMVFNPPNSNREILDYYEFNPYYDIFCFLSNSLNYYENQNKNKNNKNITEIIDIIYELFRMFLNPVPTVSKTNETNKFIKKCINYMKGGMPWRPLPENLSMNWRDDETKMEFVRASRANVMLDRITDYIKYKYPFNGIPSDPNNIGLHLDRYGILITNQITKMNTISAQFGDIKVETDMYFLPTETECLNTTYYNYNVVDTPDRIDDNVVRVGLFEPHGTQSTTIPSNIRKTYEDYNYTRPLLMDASTQYIHHSFINVEEGRKKGYEFRFDCCKLDMRNYFQNTNIKSGIAVNSSFFKILPNEKSFLPIGVFRTTNFSSRIKPPKEYARYYGIVGIDLNGNLEVDTVNNEKRYEQVLTVGPLLVRNGVEVMTDNFIRNNPIFQCHTDKKFLSEHKDVKNCNTIMPGELSHGSNPNPRSAIGVDKIGNVIIVHVEGRGQRGAGMDFVQLAQLMTALGAYNAVNLDGGRSSQITWRKPGENIINIDSHHTTGAYPVGNIISYVKRI